MKFLILNRDKVEYYKGTEKYILISACDDSDSRANLKLLIDSNRLDILTLNFHDIDREREGLICFDESKANAIIDFVEKYKDKVDLIICQCEAGLSRSAGMAGALGKILNGDDRFAFDSPYIPNKLVYTVLLRVSVERGYDEWLKKRLSSNEEIF